MSTLFSMKNRAKGSGYRVQGKCRETKDFLWRNTAWAMTGIAWFICTDRLYGFLDSASPCLLYTFNAF